MNRGSLRALLLAAGVGALSLELIAALAAAPHARNALASAPGRALLKAGEVVWNEAATSTASTLIVLAGDAVLYSVAEASRIYGAMQRFVPEDLVVSRSWAFEAPGAEFRVIECRVQTAACASRDTWVPATTNAAPAAARASQDACVPATRNAAPAAACASRDACVPATRDAAPAVKATPKRSSLLWSRVLVAS